MNLVDVFNQDAFSTVSLTDAINKFPHQPTLLDEMGLFETVPIKDTTAIIEDLQGQLTLVPTVRRNGPSIPGVTAKRTALNLTVPSWKMRDAIYADDIIGVRGFGSQDPMTGIQELLGRKMLAMRKSLEATQEYLRLQACTTGILTYPTNSVDANLSLHTAFGTTQDTVDIALDTSTTAALQARIPEIADTIEANLGNTPYNQIIVLCGRTFFRTLISHSLIKEAYNHYAVMQATLPIGMKQTNRRMFKFENFTFIEYYGSVGGQAYINTDLAWAFPDAPGLFKSVYAPAPVMEAVGTLGQPFYMRQWVDPDGTKVNLEVQSCALHYCGRPQTCVAVTKS